MNEEAIRDKLVERGRSLFNTQRLIELTNCPDANALLNPLGEHPHAFVLGCVMDRQIKAEKAWLIPYLIKEQLGGFSIDLLLQQSPEEINRLMSNPKPLHRFVDIMSDLFHKAVQRIGKYYAKDASRIWNGKPSSAEVVYRFLEFDGVGPKIGTMAANILARDFKIQFADYFAIDISADVHIRRVFARLGLCESGASVEQIIYRARALHPEFPGIIDLPCWEIGTKWCKARDPECAACYMKDLCPWANGKK